MSKFKCNDCKTADTRTATELVSKRGAVMTVTCPRCKYEFDMEKTPKLGWICNFCSEELGIKLDDNIFAQSPRNDLEERRLDEDYDGDVENKIEAKRKGIS